MAVVDSVFFFFLKKGLAPIYFSVTVSSLFYIPVLFSVHSGLHDSGF